MTAFSNALIFAETAGGDSGTGSAIAGLLPFLLIGAAFFFLIIRPQRKRQAEQRSMLRQVSVGDDIVTIGGFHGTIRELDDETMEVELAPGVVVTMARNALSKTVSEPAPFSLDDDDFDDDDDDLGDDDDFGDDADFTAADFDASDFDEAAFDGQFDDPTSDDDQSDDR